MSYVTSYSDSATKNNNICSSSSNTRKLFNMDDTNNVVADIDINKTKQIERRYEEYRRKRKRPCKAPVIPTMESTTGDTATASHGFISVIGRRRVMEDAIKVIPRFMAAEKQPCGYDFFAVYDGHGGMTVANACRDRLHLLLAEEVKEGGDQGLDWCKAMCSCFMKMDREIGVSGGGNGDVDANNVGSTAAVVVVGKEEIIVANCGDSRAILCSGGVAVALSRDHKPDLPDERERIEAAGGRVINWNGSRVLGILATSRSIGDHCMKPFVISQPEINVHGRTKSDEFVVVASDGLWDVVSNSFVCEVVKSCLQGHMRRNNSDNVREDLSIKGYAAEAAAILAELAMAKGSKDNISVIVIQLNNTNI
ncbi:probable protein phosphatase 2C 8 [Vicia villosa]|uniref:probable protein phosphatase 2C 8 n=1 Tax=Vicia villosa TaxID=3911 RepID=UPI00273C789F|nr:probable protein phosphatase 2C 8 [Vicia villosa]